MLIGAALSVKLQWKMQKSGSCKYAAVKKTLHFYHKLHSFTSQASLSIDSDVPF